MTYFPLPPFFTSPRRIMLAVWFAAIPALATTTYFWGWGPLIHVTSASLFALLLEAAMLRLRHQPILPRLKDGSVLITALLFAISLPPTLSIYLLLIGIFFAVVIGKHLYGGLGHNIFNPAMIGYAILLISFPQQMTLWALSPLDSHQLSLWMTIKIIFVGTDALAIDAITQATPLDTARTLIRTQADNLSQFFSLEVLQDTRTCSWAWINTAWLIGGMILLLFRLISGAIVLSFFAGFCGFAWLFSTSSADSAPVLFHLLTGATMMGAFFIATDPITAPTTLKGKCLFGAGIGILTYLIRTQSHYPDGIAFAVLFMNMTVPLIDQFTTQYHKRNLP